MAIQVAESQAVSFCISVMPASHSIPHGKSVPSERGASQLRKAGQGESWDLEREPWRMGRQGWRPPVQLYLCGHHQGMT